jgi:hypothetical protein
LKNRRPGNAGTHLFLEHDLQTKSEVPLVDQPAFRIDVGDLRESVEVQSAIGVHLHTGDIGLRIGKMGRVSHVETLSSKLKGPVFLKCDSAEKRSVQINGTRSDLLPKNSTSDNLKSSPKAFESPMITGGLTDSGGVCFLREFLRVLQIRRLLTKNLDHSRRKQRYRLAPTTLAFSSGSRSPANRVIPAFQHDFQFLTGRKASPITRQLRRFLLQGSRLVPPPGAPRK